jgi:hypothetical protein
MMKIRKVDCMRKHLWNWKAKKCRCGCTERISITQRNKICYADLREQLAKQGVVSFKWWFK